METVPLGWVPRMRAAIGKADWLLAELETERLPREGVGACIWGGDCDCECECVSSYMQRPRVRNQPVLKPLSGDDDG